MELPKQFDNITLRVIDDLKATLKSGSKVSMAAASFSIYAFEALQKELESLQKKMRKEPQLDRQLAMNKQVKAKRKELDNLKKKLEELK